MMNLFLICVCIRGDILTTYCMDIIFKRKKILYMRGIDSKVTHARGSWFSK